MTKTIPSSKHEWHIKISHSDSVSLYHFLWTAWFAIFAFDCNQTYRIEQALKLRDLLNKKSNKFKINRLCIDYECYELQVDKIKICVIPRMIDKEPPKLVWVRSENSKDLEEQHELFTMIIQRLTTKNKYYANANI